MTNDISQRLLDANITLPTPPAPAANYVPFTIAGSLLTISGQLPMVDGKLVSIGHVGKDVSVEDAMKAAQICAINILANANIALNGDLSRIQQTIRLGGFVSSAPDFTGHPQIINGASDLIATILGDAGKHARFAVGVAALPLGASVEVDAQFWIEE